ncbi:unnamed protein product, partial [Ostreobium quekettii]
VRVEALTEGVEAPPNLSDCRFEVRQRYQYSARRAYARELAKHGHGSEAEDGGAGGLPSWEGAGGQEDDDHRGGDHQVVRRKPSGLAARRPNAQAVKRLQALQDATKKERKVNDEEFLRLIGEPILYGQVLQLKHVTSGRYLSIRKTAADVERGALKTTLQDGGTAGSWFRIVSGYRTKIDGDRVLFGDLVALESVSFGGMGLHVSV